MIYNEQTVTFECAGQGLVGVACVPDRPCELGMIVVVGGPQYRAGSHRQFVEMTRRVAAEGYACLRFDVRGMGDSEGEQRSFEDLDADIAAAIDALMSTVPAVRRVVLWGLCDGASAALLFLDRNRGERRVVGLCLLNPWVRSAASLAQTHVRHYYLERLGQRDFWVKFVSGGVAWTAVRDLARNLRMAIGGTKLKVGGGDLRVAFQRRMVRAWSAFDGDILLVLSGRDYTAKEFLQVCEAEPEWMGAIAAPKVRRLDLAEADHTFSRRSDRALLERECVKWLVSLGQPVGSTGAQNCGDDAGDVVVGHA